MTRTRLFLVLAALGAAASACVSEADLLRERGDEIEKVYGLAPSEARVAAREHPELASPEVEALWGRAAPLLGMKRLAADDVGAFVALVGDKDRENKLRSLEARSTQSFLSNLHEKFAYEARFYEVDQLIAMTGQKLYGDAFTPAVRDAVELIRARAPLARFPLSTIEPAIALGAVPAPRLSRALDRFARLEIDLGVQQIQPWAIVLLAHTAYDPREGEALTALVKNLPALEVKNIDTRALGTIAAVPSTALAVELDRLGASRTWRSFVGFNQAAADWLVALAERPQAAALLSLLEDSSPEFQCVGTKEEAKALVQIDAAAPEGEARDVLASAFRARPLVERLDAPTTDMLVAFASKPELREALLGLHSAFPQWRPTASELAALQVLAAAGRDPGPVARMARLVGYELRERPLSKDEAGSLAELVKADARGLLEAIHIVLPHLVARGSAGLGELAALAKAGVTRDDIMRLDSDSFTGTLDPLKRQKIIERVKKAG